jgi:hypothetical protein
MSQPIDPSASTDNQANGPSGAPGAQSSGSLTLFRGVKSGDQLPFRLDFGGQVNAFERYRLRIPAQKMTSAASHFKVSYPNYYRGTFDAKHIELIVNSKKVPAQSSWDPQAQTIDIVPTDPVPPRSRVELVLSNAQTPAFGGTFYFACEVLSPGGVPPLLYLGTWIVSIQ